LTSEKDLDEEDKEQIKLARNRESARNSRKRKKMYLELLEKKVTQLSEFLQESKKICKNSQNLLQDLNNQIEYVRPDCFPLTRQKKEMISNKQTLFNNLATCLDSNASESNIDTIISSLKKKFGAASQDRMLILDYCFKQISDQILPIHMQYLLYAASQNLDIFAEDFEEFKHCQQQQQIIPFSQLTEIGQQPFY